MSKNIAVVKDELNIVFQDKELFETQTRAAVMLSKSTIVPNAYQGKPENCFIALNMANRMGVEPLVVMQNLYVVNGKPSWAGQACTMLIKNCGEFKNMRHVYTGERNTDSWGCYVQAERTTTGEEVKGAEVTIGTAKAEGWFAKSGSKWQTMPELMLAYRASAWFARVYCPEALMGMHTNDEILDAEAAPQIMEDVLK